MFPMHAINLEYLPTLGGRKWLQDHLPLLHPPLLLLLPLLGHHHHLLLLLLHQLHLAPHPRRHHHPPLLLVLLLSWSLPHLLLLKRVARLRNQVRIGKVQSLF